jgi:hypothetical protein
MADELADVLGTFVRIAARHPSDAEVAFETR